jgi:hypothetical protein
LKENQIGQVFIRPLIIGIGKDNVPLELDRFAESRFQNDGLRPVVTNVIFHVFAPSAYAFAKTKAHKKAPEIFFRGFVTRLTT